MQNENPDQNRADQRTNFKTILAAIRSCFSLTARERLIIIVVLAILLFGLFLRWRHLKHEYPERYEPPRPELNAAQNLIRP